MIDHEHPSGCACCGPSRRSVLAAGCTAACLGGLSPFRDIAFGAEASGKMKVRVFFVLIDAVMPVAGWPNIGYDYRPGMEEIRNGLTKGCPDIDFAFSMVELPEKATEIIGADAGNVDGYIVVQMMCKGNKALNAVLASGKPVLFADFPYCGAGSFLGHTARNLRAATPNFAFVSTERTSDLAEAARCFLLAGKEGNLKAFVDGVAATRRKLTPSNIDLSCKEDKLDILSTSDLLKALKGKKIIEVEKGWHPVDVELKESLGIEIVRVPFAELNNDWSNISKDRSMEVVRRWKSNAISVSDVSDETLEKSARMYLAQKLCLERHGAAAITIACLTGFYGNHIQAYPCLGFHQLLNEGFVGACECDTHSTLTMLVMTTLTKGRPGYISDPVIDTSTKQVIYAHCVASNKAFGPAGLANPFTIMTHSEDRQGASLRSLLPSGYMTTTLEMHPGKKEILFHQAKVVGNVIDDRACRTKLAALPVGDFEKLFSEWDKWGWHRVTYYGDLKKPVFALADTLGWKVIEEA